MRIKCDWRGAWPRLVWGNFQRPRGPHLSRCCDSKHTLSLAQWGFRAGAGTQTGRCGPTAASCSTRGLCGPCPPCSPLTSPQPPQRPAVKNCENTTTLSSPTPSSQPIQLRFLLIWHFLSVPGDVSGKEPACQCRRHKRHGFDPWIRKIPWRRAWQPTPAFLPGESHRRRSLAGHSAWGPKSQTRLKQRITRAHGEPLGTPN